MRRNRSLVVVTALCGLIPLGARAYLHHRIDRDLEPALSERLGSSVEVGDLDASITGALRLHDLSIGDEVSAHSVEAGFDPMALLAGGQLAPAELRVSRPRVKLALGGGGELATMAERVVVPAGESSDARRSRSHRPWRIVITDGDLTVDVFGRATAHLERVTVQPLADRIRLIAGTTRLRWRDRLGHGVATFERGAVDWPSGGTGARLAWTGGHGSVALGDGPSGFVRDLMMTGDRTGFVATGNFDELTGSRFTVRGQRTQRHSSLSVDLHSAPLAIAQGLAPSWLIVEGARATGQLALARVRPGSLSIAMDLTLGDAHVRHPRLAGEPLAIDSHTSLVGHLTFDDGARLVVDDVAVTRKGVTVRGKAALSLDGPLPRSATVDAAIDPRDCQTLIAAVPEPMTRSLTGLYMTGSAGARLTLDYQPKRTDLDIHVDVDGCRVVSEPVLANPRQLSAAIEHTTPDGQTRHLGVPGPDYATLGQLPGHVPAAFVASEDGRFYDHGGFDLRQIERSLALDLREQQLIRGGSTISQQLVKNLFLARDRTLARKFEEAVLTWRTEAHLSKRRILELYLNIIELGPGIYGISQAAQHWFGLSPDRLSVAQAAFLAALTPAPTSLSARIRHNGGVDEIIERRVANVLRSMRKDGYISRRDHDRALTEPLRFRSSTLARR